MTGKFGYGEVAAKFYSSYGDTGEAQRFAFSAPVFGGFALAGDKSVISKLLTAQHSQRPPSSKSVLPQSMTLRTAWHHYITTLEQEGNHGAQTLHMKRLRFKNGVEPVLGERLLHLITLDDLWEIVEAKKLSGWPSASNHLVVDIKVFFRWCVTHGRTVTGLRHNPSTDLVKLAKDKARRRTFSLAELRLFVRAIARLEDDFTRKLFLLLLLSGQRLDNVLHAKPAQWCAELEAWEIERTKNGEPNVVPMGQWGRALFASASGSWLFPSTRGSGPRIGQISALSRRVREQMQQLVAEGVVVEHWTPHDLRRVIRTHMSRLRVRGEVAERVIGHKMGGVGAIYDRYEYLDEKREALALWEGEIARIAFEEGVDRHLGLKRLPL